MRRIYVLCDYGLRLSPAYFMIGGQNTGARMVRDGHGATSNIFSWNIPHLPAAEAVRQAVETRLGPATFNDLDFASSDPIDISVTLRYDYAILEF